MKDRVGQIWRNFDNIALVFTSEEHVHEVYSLVYNAVQLWHESALLPWEHDEARMTKEEIEKDLKELRKQIGRYAVRRLREGKAVMHVWRRSSPHNKWIQNADENRGSSMLWHSDGWGDFPGSMRMYDLVDESGSVIAPHRIHNDGGKPDHSVYALKKEYRTSKRKVRVKR